MTATACPVAASLTRYLRDQDAMDAADAAVSAAYKDALADLLATCHVRTTFAGRGVHELYLASDESEMQDDVYADECADLRAWVLSKLEPIATARAKDECERKKFDGDL